MFSMVHMFSFFVEWYEDLRYQDLWSIDLKSGDLKSVFSMGPMFSFLVLGPMTL